MLNDVTVFNIRDFFNADTILDKNDLDYFLSEFSCKINPDTERFLKENSVEFTKKNQSVTYLVLSTEDTTLMGYFTLAIKTITINADQFSNTIKRKIARVSELDEEHRTYTLPAYLIAQLSKSDCLDANKCITGSQLLNAAIDTVKYIQSMVGGMVVFLESEEEKKLLQFYEEENQFKRFDVRTSKSASGKSHNLVQLLKVL